MATEQEIKIQKPTYEWMKHEGYVAEISAHNDEGKVNTTIPLTENMLYELAKEVQKFIEGGD